MLNPTTRAYCHEDDIEREEPLLINPVQQDPEEFIGFNEYMPYAINDNQYGETTIDILNLRRGDLQRQRKKRLDEFNALLTIIKKAAKNIENSDWQALADEALISIRQMVLPQAQYSAMIKTALHRSANEGKIDD